MNMDVDALRRFSARYPSYTAAVWAWLASPHGNPEFKGRSRASVIGGSTCTVLLAAAQLSDMHVVQGKGVFPGVSAADVAVLCGLSTSRVAQLLKGLTEWQYPVLGRQLVGRCWVYGLHR